MAAISNADSFYAQLPEQEPEGFAILSALVGNPDAEENGWRDYKVAYCAKNDNDGNDTIKCLLSESISAYGNTSGGVVIWGFNTKGKIPSSLSLAPDAEWLRGRLLELVNNATDPFVAGVQARCFREPGKSEGLVVCLIPESSFKPHRALWGERTCFIRTQDSCIPCPTALLRSLFYPSRVARFSGDLVLQILKAGPGRYNCSGSLDLASLGPASGENVIVNVVTEARLALRFSSAWEQFNSVGGVAHSKFVLPPNFVSKAILNIGGEISGPFKIKFFVFAHDTPVQSVEVSIIDDNLEDGYFKKHLEFRPEY